MNEDVNILFNSTDILTQHLRYQQIYTYAHTILAYLRDFPMYMKQIATFTMDYINAAMTNILSPNILPVEELRNMLRHIESQLPSIEHLSTLSDDTLHFYWYLNIHMLIADGIFLLLIDVPIQDRTQQLNQWDFQPTSLNQQNISSVQSPPQIHRSHL